MKTESLAVTYRPKKLDDLIGQDHIASQIRGMFKSKKAPGAIMLYGHSGLGKTTIARMLVRMLNCTALDKKTFAPCGECANCRMEEHPDVTELNAADARGIDDVRAIVQQARNMPSMGNKRVFIIDEAQQLTSQAQQTLLKPMEEPPPNTIWIICTMSPEKILPAIYKRCLRLQVKAVEPELIVKRLNRIAKREGLDFSEIDDGKTILKTIADFADGGVRDSITLLESVLYAHRSGEEINKKTVLAKFLASSEAQLDQNAVGVLVAVFKNDLKKLLQQTQTSENIRGVLSKLRWLIDYLLSNSVGQAKFTPYSARLYATEAKKDDVKTNLMTLIRLQALLLDIEARLNYMSVEERVVFTAMVGNFIAERKSGE